MLAGQSKPLELARRVLKSETLQSVMRSPYNVYGWKILDRWAFNGPEALQKLEATGEVVLLSCLLDQQDLEQKILLRDESLEAMQNGATERELLLLNEVQTELN